ncbi:hypothetical protein HK15_09685 [Acetobacter orientalis]|uniref:Uncharacterized protein n=1 Tax=Acetobacter orientalis TaxID=146474 RepID=A0A252B995_9PROT|nr:hypothetical protein HK15_09685 [Acetobacter orientalis]
MKIAPTATEVFELLVGFLCKEIAIQKVGYTIRLVVATNYHLVATGEHDLEGSKNPRVMRLCL